MCLLLLFLLIWNYCTEDKARSPRASAIECRLSVNMDHSSSSAAGAAASSSSGSTKIVTSLIIEFTPIYGPRVKRTVEGNGALSVDQREWLVQFITKDLLHLQQLATQLRERSNSTTATTAASSAKKDTSALRASVGGATTAGNGTLAPPAVGPMSGNASGHNSATSAWEDNADDNSFVKVICLDQLSVAVVVMFFALESDGGNAATFQTTGVSNTHMYAVAVALQNFSAIRLRVALPAIRDWLFQTHQEIMALAYEDEPLSNETLLTAVGAAGGTGASREGVSDGSAALAGGSTNTVVKILGYGAKHEYRAETIRAFVELQSAIARVPLEMRASKGIGATVSSAFPGVDPAIISAAIASSSPPQKKQQDNGVDIEEEWYAKLFILNPLLDTWIYERINRDHIDIDSTIFSRTTWSAQQLYGLLVAALSHHRCILRADDPSLVEKWLKTIALFLPDDRLLFASVRCFTPPPAVLPLNIVNPLWSPILAPDLNFQGTTATVNEILEKVHHFRYPPVIIDVSRKLEDPAHFYPTSTLTFFAETRRRIFRREVTFRPVWDYPGSKTRPPQLKTSSLIGPICARLKAVVQPPQAQPHQQQAATSSVANASMTSMKSIVVTPSGAISVRPSSNLDSYRCDPNGPAMLFPVAPASGTVSFDAIESIITPSHKLRFVADAIQHWRKQLLLKSMAFYVYEIEIRREAPNPALLSTLRISEADHRVLCVAVDFIAQVQEAKEKRVRDVLQDTFAF